METYLLDWANLLLRWLHVITAIAWIGSSFYFVWLDNHLVPPADPALRDKGVGGALWAVHGGGFYHPQKYLGAPPRIDSELHWFYWESYSTWLSGFALFTMLYLFNAGTFLIDKSVYAWGPAAAIGASLGLLVAFWLVYDLICRVFGQRPGGDRIVGVLVALVVAVSAWGVCQLFAGRAAFLLVGAMMATTMSANVAMWIIPGQRKVVAAIQAGAPVDPVHGQRGKQRSQHNTYFTLPVLVAMLSNHYGQLYTHRWNWVLLILLMLCGALIRQFFVARHKTQVNHQPSPWGWVVAGLVPLVAAIALAAPWGAAGSSAAAVPAANLAQLQTSVEAVVQQRCVMCHNAQVQNKGVALHTPELLQHHAVQVHQQAVVLKAMPMGNATGITDEERALIGRWFQARQATP
ncbi:MAG: hypothetical protein CFE46_06070 [Burkholderiales bacterium PBB6]|nr:MAG: hypothetical protein CFE46_06070 [Burkholderiales bacterium PBB6]